MSNICPFFGPCGGCSLMDLPYADQVAVKTKEGMDYFSEIDFASVIPTVICDEDFPQYFRNKIRYGFIETQGGILPSRHNTEDPNNHITIDSCLLHSPLSIAIAQHTGQLASKLGWKVYNPRDNQGFLKDILIRKSKAYNKFLISLVTTEASPDLTDWVSMINQDFPEVVSIWQTKTSGKNNFNSKDIYLWGEKCIVENIGGFDYRIMPHAFFQTNTDMTKKLYDLVQKSADLKTTDIVWDLYAGSATIGIYLAHMCHQVISIESATQNIEDAIWNIEKNNICNLEIIGKRVEEAVNSQLVKEFPPDIVIVDPPRAGLSENLIRILAHLNYRRLVYVSCNPATLARDVKYLHKASLKPISLTPVDMFPHSHHLEMVCVMEKS